ncbi:ribosome maturation factor RimP [Deinococcus sp. Marseille-Q6407]|uniref:ribosome maturation factor RimP n=1 Tax=Deinococcus sp. Marseille-Q6407 TaxID=2969223 RepID=UPI0021C1178C|nr:ribosome maturation factor RimP [Deinococcus sp. Marseille-Q6407]
MNNNSDLNNQIAQQLGEEYELLEVQMQNASGRPVLLVRLDRMDEQPVTVDDIEQATRRLSNWLDEADPIGGEYRLEIESPGAKRPLLRTRHFERMLGLKAKVRGGKHAFTAPIKAVNGEEVTFDVPGQGDLTLRIAEIKANLAEFPSEHR